MQWGKTIKRICSAAISGVMLLTMTAAMPMESTAASICTVNTNKTYQRIRGFGGMNLPEWQGYDLTDAQIQTVFGNGDGQLGLTILRIYVSDDSSAWKNVVPTAKAAQKLGATIFATPWNPPSSMRSAGSGGTHGGKYVPCSIRMPQARQNMHISQTEQLIRDSISSLPIPAFRSRKVHHPRSCMLRQQTAPAVSTLTKRL